MTVKGIISALRCRFDPTSRRAAELLDIAYAGAQQDKVLVGFTPEEFNLMRWAVSYARKGTPSADEGLRRDLVQRLERIARQSQEELGVWR